MKPSSSSGFSLVELAVTVLILGLLFTFSVPSIKHFTTDYKLKSATENIEGQLRLAREKAISTGSTQWLRFMAGFSGSDYHVWDGTTASPSWKLPTGITYYWGSGTQTDYRMTKDGRCLDSGMIIVQDSKGRKDTVMVELSGLVLPR